MGYIYVTAISLSGFWFGVTGGVIAAVAASAVFIGELVIFRDLLQQDVAVSGLFFRLLVYFFAGILLGYLSRAERKKMLKIKKLSEQKNMFVGIAAHDLKNPLTSVALSAHSLLQDFATNPPPPDKVKVTLRAIHETSERILAFINDLLDITKIEAGRLDLKVSNCNYVDLVNQNVQLNRIIAERCSIDLVVRSEGEVPEMVIDAMKINQVLNNLMENAIRYAPRGTEVTVSIKLAANELRTSVQDEGPGISPEDIPYIFSAFYRSTHVDNEAVKQKSTGLGLAIAKLIVEAHGGRIWVDSSPGKGALFTFTLPLEYPS